MKKNLIFILILSCFFLSVKAQQHPPKPPPPPTTHPGVPPPVLPGQTDDLNYKGNDSLSHGSESYIQKGDTTKVAIDTLVAPAEPYRNIQFEFDSSVLKKDAYPILDATATDLKANGARCELDGFASSDGTAAHNMRLSKDRANSVKTYLVNAGVLATNLKVKAFGETHPIADNSTEDGRILNRRVEFKKLR